MDLIEADRPLRKPSYFLLFNLAFLGISYSLGAGFVAARNGQAAPVYLFAATTWICYMLAHFCAEGRFTHPQQEESHHPQTRREIVEAVVGAASMLSGIGVLATGVSASRVGIATVGAALFFAGYIITHYAGENDLL